MSKKLKLVRNGTLIGIVITSNGKFKTANRNSNQIAKLLTANIQDEKQILADLIGGNNDR